jgi:hypothetical protein
MNGLTVGPPQFQAIRHEVAGVSRGSEDDVELIVVNFQDTGRCEYGLGMHVMVRGAHKLLPSGDAAS